MRSGLLVAPMTNTSTLLCSPSSSASSCDTTLHTHRSPTYTSQLCTYHSPAHTSQHYTHVITQHTHHNLAHVTAMTTRAPQNPHTNWICHNPDYMSLFNTHKYKLCRITTIHTRHNVLHNDINNILTLQNIHRNKKPYYPIAYISSITELCNKCMSNEVSTCP